MPPVQYEITGLSLRWSYFPLSISATKSGVVSTSGMTAFLNLPMRASYALLPSKKTTSSPRSATSWLTSTGLRCTPPPMIPFSLTLISSGTPNVTISSRTRISIRGKSLPMPSDHLKSMVLKAGNSLVTRTYFLIDDNDPPTVPLMPSFEMMIRPLRSRRSQSARCHRRIASGSASGVNL